MNMSEIAFSAYVYACNSIAFLSSAYDYDCIGDPLARFYRLKRYCVRRMARTMH